MAGLDKSREFYTCASRFEFLASAYRPDDLPKEINEALDVFCKFVQENADFKRWIGISQDFFDEADKEREAYRMKEVMKILIHGDW